MSFNCHCALGMEMQSGAERLSLCAAADSLSVAQAAPGITCVGFMKGLATFFLKKNDGFPYFRLLPQFASPFSFRPQDI